MALADQPNDAVPPVVPVAQALDLARETPLRVEAAAKLFKVHRRTVENWFARGLPYVKIGRIRYTSREAIARFAEPSVTPAPPTADKDAIRRSMEARELMRTRFGF